MATAELPAEIEVVVIGGGPAGLAVASCLAREGVPYLLLERGPTVAPGWRRHYDRLHLHTSRGYSGLPGLPMSDRLPRYPSRDQVVEYFDTYVSSLGLTPSLGVDVEHVSRGGSGWMVQTSHGAVLTRAVVLATGANGEPVLPTWPGMESFPGPVVHSSVYRNGSDLVEKQVLVVGFGNSGGEIALDLVEHGARPAVSVRSPVNIVPRDILGIPVLGIAIPLSRLPSRLADALIWPVLKLYYPSYSRLGLRKAARGPLSQIAASGRIPLLDIGTIRRIREGAIDVAPGVARIDANRVTFDDGSTGDFDAIILATGYRPSVPGGLGEPGVSMEADGRSGLYYCGFHIAATGMFREVGIEAVRIASQIRRLL